MDECNVIESLLSRSFGSKNFSEKNEIVDRGRPTPQLPTMKQLSKKGEKVFVRSFQTTNYEKHKWLAGSSKLSKLFCWPCILFNDKDKTAWNKTGFEDLGNLSKAINRHEKTKSHMSSCLLNASFGRVRIDIQLDQQIRQETSAHNLTVQKNREMLRRFIDVVCFLGKQELSFRGRDESEESTNRGNYVELVELLSTYDPALKRHLETSTVFSGLSNRIQNDLIAAVKDVMNKTIKEEIRDTPFVAVSLDETSDITSLSQLTTIVRYVKQDGKAVERFLGFCDVSEDRTAGQLKIELDKTLAEYQCGDKLIAQTYDGASVMAGELTGLQTRVREDYPCALFIHCCGHALNLVLAQATSSTKECRVFFTTIPSLSSFFHRSSKRTILLDRIVGRRIPTGTAVRWHYHSRLINAVHETRGKLVEVFDYIIEHNQDFDGKTLTEARGYRQILSEFQFVFCLKVFNDIFGLTGVLYDIIQSKQFDIAYCIGKVRETKQSIAKLRENFEKYWNDTLDVVHPPTRRNQSAEATKLSFRQMFYSVIDTIVVQIGSRFQSLQQRKFVSLLDHRKHESYCQDFPEGELESLQSIYGKFVDIHALKNELTVVYASADLKSNPVFEIISRITDLDLKSCFPEVYKLCQLILTMPSTSASAERSFSALKRIKTYLRSTQGQNRLSALATISIESALLSEIRQKPEFYDKVIQKFCSKERRMDFTFK